MSSDTMDADVAIAHVFEMTADDPEDHKEVNRVLFAAKIRLFDIGDGGTHCIAFGENRLIWPPKGAVPLAKGRWVAVAKIADVLRWANKADIETPEDFGMPLTERATCWLVVTFEGDWRFSLI